MKVYEAYGKGPGTQFHDIVVAENQEQLKEILGERYGGFLKFDSWCISAEKIRVSELTAGDLIRLLGK